MVKFASKTTKSQGTHGPTKVVGETRTFEGAKGYTLDDKSALMFLASTSMVGEKSFYESEAVRDGRLKGLVHSVTAADPEFIQRFVPYLRNEMNMRSAAVVVACEYLSAGGPKARGVIDAACSRADEPAEILAYWMQEYYGWDGESYPLPSPKLPQALRKGLGDAVNRLYTERAVLKYNGLSRGVSMGNVLDLIHPKTDGPNPIFKYIVDKHHGNPTEIGELNQIQAWHELQGVDPDSRRDLLNDPQVLRNAGMTWEALSGWLGGPMNAQAWEAMIEAGMGYMALLRNLRNFEQANISKKHRDIVIDKLTDPQEVASSRQFPYRFFSAYKMLQRDGYLSFLPAISDALDFSVDNFPVFSGKSLIVTDMSGSMGGSVSNNSIISCADVAALFAVALARKNEGADLIGFADRSERFNIPMNSSILPAVDKIGATNLGGATMMMQAINKGFDNHDRVIIFSDMQCWGTNRSSYWGRDEDLRFDPPIIHSYDLRGYNRVPFEIGSKGRFMYAGFSDKMVPLMLQMEKFHAGEWPF